MSRPPHCRRHILLLPEETREHRSLHLYCFTYVERLSRVVVRKIVYHRRAIAKRFFVSAETGQLIQSSRGLAGWIPTSERDYDLWWSRESQSCE